MKNLLIVEDDTGIQEMLTFSLQDQNFNILIAGNSNQAWNILNNNDIDLILLDWMLPDVSGIELLRRIRTQFRDVLVIMLTAKSDESDRVQGLEYGADDYVTKPFSVAELRARIKALMRRTANDDDILQIGELSLNPSSHRVKIADREINLSPIEFRLLHFFMTHPDRVYNRDQLLDRIWGQQVYVQERTVDVHVRRLRKNLEPFGLKGLIQTVHGSGYRFSALH